MERRKLLIGSGATFVTALAGCVGSDSDDDADDTESTDDSGDDHSDDSGEDESSEDESSDDELYDNVPGFDAEELSIDSDKVYVDRVAYDDDLVSIDATTETTDPEELYAELDTLGTNLSEPTTDIDELKESVDIVEWTVTDADGETIGSFNVEPIWIYNYMNDDITEDEFLDLVLETVA